MAQGEFKHISVTAAEEDDVIISAGIVPRSEGSASASYDAPSPEPEPVQDPEEAEPEEEAGRPDPAPEKAEASPGDASDHSARGAHEGSRQAAQDGYREATLEDLRGEPMPLTQKVVIIAALVCIIGALAYYFLFLR